MMKNTKRKLFAQVARIRLTCAETVKLSKEKSEQTHCTEAFSFRMLFLFIAIGFSSTSAFAGREQVDVAKGVIMANYTLEKCKNVLTPDDIIKRQVKVMLRQGVTSNEVDQGFQEGMMQVELKYPGSKKPPKSECAKAQYLYNEFLKFL